MLIFLFGLIYLILFFFNNIIKLIEFETNQVNYPSLEFFFTFLKILALADFFFLFLHWKKFNQSNMQT